MLTYLVILYFCALVHATCPNRCGDSASCCEVQPDKFSCCPYTNGICCTDNKHCCPQGSVCDATELTCKYPIGPNWPVRSLYNPDAKKDSGEEFLLTKPSHIVCPDGLSFCSKENTCCPMSGGRWGCCEHSQGICCSDGGHCCPANTTCNPQDGSCLPLEQDSTSSSSGTASASLFQPRPSGGERGMSSSIHACDSTGQYSCPNDTTCCREKTGDWGCCPLSNAICCSDGLHCCPHDTVCNIKTGSCIPSSMVGTEKDDGSDKRVLPLAAVNSSSEQICADQKTRCSGSATCCRLADHKSYGCCPLREAVCCSDGKHCCPKGYTCNVKEGTCVGNDDTASSRVLSQVGGVPEDEAVNTTCPGGLVSCLSGTCCPTALGNYRCCPYKSGVCCPNTDHCCPANSECSPSLVGTCLPLATGQSGNGNGDRDHVRDRDHVSQSISTTVITGRGSQQEVVFCPGQDFYCPNATTCCLGEGTSWSCCPHRHAVCCSDRTHCCPLGTRCSSTHQGCIPVDSEDSAKVDRAPVLPSTRVSELQKHVPAPTPSMCPDQKTACDDHMPCCQLVDGQWGCCPLSNGVCCAHTNHCCPLGTKCSEQGYCSTNGQLYTAPYMIPGRQSSSPDREAFLSGVDPVSFHFPLAGTAQPATRDLMLLSASYRMMKEFHHSVCPSGVHRCSEDEQCCPSDRHGYTCAPKTSTCCSPGLDTVCPLGKVCSSFGMICHPA